MPKKSRKEKDDPAVDLPEEQIEKVIEEEAKDKAPKTRRTSSGSRKGKQAEDVDDTPQAVQEEPRPSPDDLLAEVRQTLVSGEDTEEKKGFFDRVKERFGKRSKAEEEEAKRQAEEKAELEAALDELTAQSKPGKKRHTTRKKEEEAIQEFFSDLEALSTIGEDDAGLAALEAKVTELEEKKPAKKAEVPRLPKKSDEKEIDFEKIRDVALEEYDDTKIEPTAQPKHLQDEVRETLKESRPLDRAFLIAGVVITVGLLLFSGIYLIANSITIPTPVPTPTLDLTNVTYPTRIILPGGWQFGLGQGEVVDGVWSPQGAEWLVGTEISRWVALEWNVQLEAVLRTLKSGDKIELQMSNFDTLVYGVHSIQRLTMEELLTLDRKSPNLIVVLYADESEGGYWVVTALPEGLKDD